MKVIYSKKQIDDINKRSRARFENERYLLDIIKEQFDISEADMEDTAVVTAKVRDYKINKVLK